MPLTQIAYPEYHTLNGNVLTCVQNIIASRVLGVNQTYTGKFDYAIADSLLDARIPIRDWLVALD